MHLKPRIKAYTHPENFRSQYMPRYPHFAIHTLQLQPKPSWIRSRIPTGATYHELEALLHRLNLHTVCEEAHCPNLHECWGGGTATIMLLGDTCTRGCRFCNVKTGNPKGLVNPFEPHHVAYALKQLHLDYVVLTSVDRDDLPDGGAQHFAQTVWAIRHENPHIFIEVLIPDFQNDLDALRTVVHAHPDVLDHNIETTRSLTPRVRDPRATYHQSLSVLKTIKKLDPTIYTKSSIMLGLGETEEELVQTMCDLRTAHVDFLTLGQYLQPSPHHLRVHEYISPATFQYLQSLAERLGFLYVAAGPLVRSSYRAGEFFIRHILTTKAKAISIPEA